MIGTRSIRAALAASLILQAGPVLAQPATGDAPKAGAPAAGAPAGKPATTPQVVPRSDEKAGPKGKPYTEPELKALKEIEDDLKRVQRAADTHQERVKDYLYGQYLDRKARLEKRYADSIKKAEGEERKRHLAAIAVLEKFILDYPNHPQFTPDAMFRLADLYLDEANYEFEQRFDAVADSGVPPEGEDMQRADYSKALALWTQIIEKFPDYRQRAGTMYLLAYYLKETGEDRRSLAVYRGLVCGNKYNPLGAAPPAPNRDKVRLSTAATARGSRATPGSPDRTPRAPRRCRPADRTRRARAAGSAGPCRS